MGIDLKSKLFCATIALGVLSSSCWSKSTAIQGAGPAGASDSASLQSASTRASFKASDFPGADAGAQIAAALALFGTLGIKSGIVDATDLNGRQTISSELRIGNDWASSYTVLLGRAYFVTSAKIIVGRGSALVGTPMGSYSWAADLINNPGVRDNTSPDNPRGTVIRAANGAALFPGVVLVGDGSLGTGDGTLAAIQDITIDGNGLNGGTDTWGNGLFVEGAMAVDLTRVAVVGANGHGISLSSISRDGKFFSAGISNLTKVFSSHNGHCGLAISNATDVLITQSQFEFNSTDGVCLSGSRAIRISTSDFGANGRNGLYADNDSSVILNGNQFGNNTEHDLRIVGGWGGSVVSGNQFIGSSFRAAVDSTGGPVSAIFISGDQNSAITGNFINSTPGYPLNSAIHLDGGAHAVAGNAISGIRGPGGAISLTGGATMSTNNLDAMTPPAPK
jgi:hypothetical protein